MRFLVDIVHPADVLFFLRPIRILKERGHAVDVASRRKDVTGDLLVSFGIEHTPVSDQGQGLISLGLELVRRDLAIYRRLRSQTYDATLGFGGVAISHAGRVAGVPSHVVYDSENATLQTRLAWPFLTRLIVPEDYAGKVPDGRTERLPGIKELSYFHPAAFRPDREIALSLGLAPDRPNIFLRLVRWGANHDVGKTGWSAAQTVAVVAALAPLAKLHVSAEADPPEALTPHLYRGDPKQVHHLLAHCDGYVGESATMACEAATLGTPAIYAGVDLPGYVAGMDRRGLVQWIPPDRRGELPERASALVADRTAFAQAHAAWIAALPDWAEAVADRAETLGRNGASR